MPLSDALAAYDPSTLTDGLNSTPDGDAFYISNPALGLWAFERNMPAG